MAEPAARAVMLKCVLRCSVTLKRQPPSDNPWGKSENRQEVRVGHNFDAPFVVDVDALFISLAWTRLAAGTAQAE
ncbi:hypothetical protein ACWGNE_24815 [Streptomyces xiamenensis]